MTPAEFVEKWFKRSPDGERALVQADLTALLADAVQGEREACAKVAEGMIDEYTFKTETGREAEWTRHLSRQTAAAIRQRGAR